MITKMGWVLLFFTPLPPTLLSIKLLQRRVGTFITLNVMKRKEMEYWRQF